jgi:transposase-like protein
MRKISYAGYRFPPEVLDQAIWLYLRFTLSFRDVEDLLAERGIVMSYETVRRWVNHFGAAIRRSALRKTSASRGFASTPAVRHMMLRIEPPSTPQTDEAT